MSESRRSEDDQLSHDIEKAGYLLKKTSKGLMVNRYFVTERNILSYWHDLNSYQQRDKPSERYDIAEMKSIERTSNRGLSINFLNTSKFKLELRAMVDNERNEWAGILEGKSKLYSVDALLADLRMHTLSFRTKTFETLMYLHEKDQNKWVLDRLDEVFEVSGDDSKSAQLRSNSSRLLCAACTAVDEFLSTCADAEQEMTSREPKIMAHTRNYIKRYAEILKGRLMLELLYLPGVEHKTLDELGEKALCAALELAHRFDRLYDYPFVPRDMIRTMNQTLFSLGDVLAALIKLSVHRVDAYFDELTHLSTIHRSKKLWEVMSLSREINNYIREDIDDASLYETALQQMTQTQILTFSDHFTALDLSDYEEVSLMEHIKACDKIYESVAAVTFNLTTRQVLCDHAVVVKPTAADCAHELASSSPTEDAPVDKQIKFSKSVLDALKCACDDSARRAFLRAMHILQGAKSYLLDNMLREQSEGWVGGILCKALVNTVSTWADTVKEIMPLKFERVTFIETSRLLISMYLQHMFSVYKQPRMIALSARGVQQLQEDWKIIYLWIVERTLPTECLAEKALCKTMSEGFVVCSESDALQVFAEAVRSFGLKHECALYDLFRLVLKFRIDVHPKVRKAILSLCTEFLDQLRKATATDPQLMQGTLPQTDILGNMFPLAGVEHCTGTKWKWEKSADPTATRLTVTLVVTDTINDALEMRRAQTIRDTCESRIQVKRAAAVAEAATTTSPKDDATATVTAEAAAEALSAPSSSSRTAPPPPPPPSRRATISGLPPSEPLPTATDVSVSNSDAKAPHRPPPPSTPPPSRRLTVTDATSQGDVTASSPVPSAGSLESSGLFSRADSECSGTDSVSHSAPVTSARQAPPKPQRRASAPSLPPAQLEPPLSSTPSKLSDQDAIVMLLRSAQSKLADSSTQ